ncbi:ABC superfamily ATP binding cassette transporter, membrane protein [Lactobacillus selangorensis]|uniref:ABC superfamily ATP binding cassette transporter, membrane protein n=1 Tax=Lactobacillus selangorensis TaxID=81857 RepID=A0A0R2FR57_9LACO|nr:ABC transporter permease [Lactobacillus selangorensis]KRN28146.1 ABC superfamily ATP binding cassette transporter, membrane protein [Lactobacillus selangorensis]KRN30978.1 ABC superfamily ATP binding cassette transporter, membrane protein [Lactobacillus selangorensis]
MVQEKRTEIGTLRALGYTKWEAMAEFILYGTLSALIGAVIGAYAGCVILPKAIFNAYAANFIYSAVQINVYWGVIAIATLLALACTLIAVWSVGHKALQENPAQLMLPEPPKGGTRILLERIKPLWKRLPFSQKVTARNLFRYKSRMLMTIVGVAGCVTLLITGFGISDSLNNIVSEQYSQIVHYDLIGVYNNSATASQKKAYQKAVADQSAVKKFSQVYEQSVTAKNSTLQDNQSITLLVPKNQKQFKQEVTLKNRQSGRTLKLSDHGVILTEKLAKLFNVKKGDHFTFKDANGHAYHVKVAGITEMYVGHTLYMSPAYYHQIMKHQVRYNADMIQLQKRDNATINHVSQQLMKQEAAVTVVQSNTAKKMIEHILGGLNHVVIILVVAASMLAFVVLFTLTNINIDERVRALATLKVLGFYPKEVLMYIFRETILLTVIGILFGYGCGYLFHQYIMDVLPPEMAMSNPGLLTSNFVISTVMTLLFLGIVMLLMARKIKNIDMLGALKSVD